jgi:hypothetical protein
MKNYVLFLTLLIAGCVGAPVKTADPTPAVAGAIAAAKTEVATADKCLVQVPPMIPEARKALKAADNNLDTATNELQDVSEEFKKIDGERVTAIENLQKERASFWSYRQRKLFWIFTISCILFGTLATVGNYFPGWWSLPCLWAVKLLKFVVFGGIPHLVAGIVWLWKKLFRKSTTI